MSNKEKWLNVAELFDAFRLVPRLVLAAILLFAGWYIFDITQWYMNLPAEERTGMVSGFVGISVPAVFGLAGKVADWYLKTGRKWTD